MNDEWKYKELPRASGQIAPAQWNPETGEWEVFTGLAKVQDVAVEARLQAIESKQQAILDKLESGLDTRLTGSIVVEEILMSSEIVTAGSVARRGLRLADCESFAIGITTDDSHSHAISYVPTSLNWAAFGSLATPEKEINFTHNRNYTQPINVVSERGYLSIINKDSKDHTYNVYLYKKR